jgi:formylglycine-generating enzyme required for sulfatase activity
MNPDGRDQQRLTHNSVHDIQVAWKPVAIATPTVVASSPSLGDTLIRPADGMTMVYVPAGEFPMGSDDAEVDIALEMCNTYYGNCEREWFEVEQPVHAVALDDFWIDRTEVTNVQYRQCVEAGACDPLIRTYLYDSDYDDHPAFYVKWPQANAYCEWVGAQLPTEAEWEYAARGPEGQRYPWGDEFVGTQLNICDASCENAWADETFDDGYSDIAPVGSYPGGASWCGALDIAGNVMEWTADWYGEYPSDRQVNPTGPSSGGLKVLRGDAADGTRAVSRSAARHGEQPDRVYKYIGFRCVQDN